MRSHPRSPLLRKPRDGLDCYTRFFFLFFFFDRSRSRKFLRRKTKGSYSEENPKHGKKGPLGVIVVFTEVCGCKTSKLPTFVILLCLFSSSLLLYLDRNHERKTCMRDPLGFGQFAFRVKGRRRHVLRVTLGDGVMPALVVDACWVSGSNTRNPAGRNRKQPVYRGFLFSRRSTLFLSDLYKKCLLVVSTFFVRKGGTPTSGSN